MDDEEINEKKNEVYMPTPPKGTTTTAFQR